MVHNKTWAGMIMQIYARAAIRLCTFRQYSDTTHARQHELSRGTEDQSESIYPGADGEMRVAFPSYSGPW